MPETIKLSDKAYFSIADGSIDDEKQITFFYNDPQKTHGDTIMLVQFPENALPNEPPIETPMIYDEKTQRYTVEIKKSADVGEMFIINTAKVPGKMGNEKEPVLQKGFLALKGGKQQPVNSTPGVPQGKLETFLLTKDWQIQMPISTDAKTLKDGERFIQVYTPPDYDPHRVPPYNLQINLDGGQYLWPMQTNVVLDNLIAANEIEPVITVFISPHSGPPNENCKGYGIVMPKGYPLSMRFKEYSCNTDFADKLAAMPTALRERFTITNDPKHTTIWGVSKGGLQSIYTALLHPNVFGNVVAESPEAWNIPVQNGPDWRAGIVDTVRDGIDCTWETSTSKLPEEEGNHNEYVTQMLHSRFDPISGRTLDFSKPIVFYLDAGEREREYNPGVGSANLVKATEVFADTAKRAGHTVIDDDVHIIKKGGHHNMTWIRNIADAARSIHSSLNRLTIGHTQLFSFAHNKSHTKESNAEDIKKMRFSSTEDRQDNNKPPTSPHPF